MHGVELVLICLLVGVSVLSAASRSIGVPYPIVLVLGGLVMGFIPGIPEVELDPELVLVIFLPPLLYSAAFFASLRDLKYDIRSISLMAIGLVIVTAAVVAVVAHALIDDLPWAAAGYWVWTILTFLLNALLSVLIGWQLPLILDGLAGEPIGELIGVAAAVA